MNLNYNPWKIKFLSSSSLCLSVFLSLSLCFHSLSVCISVRVSVPESCNSNVDAAALICKEQNPLIE